MDKLQEKIDEILRQEMQQRRTKELVEKEARLDEVILEMERICSKRIVLIGHQKLENILKLAKGIE